LRNAESGFCFLENRATSKNFHARREFAEDVEFGIGMVPLTIAVQKLKGKTISGARIETPAFVCTMTSASGMVMGRSRRNRK
jgi:hypothetical protein